MPKLKAEQKSARRQRVERAALGLFCERGFHGVGLRDIAQEAGLSIGNIYNYYPGKESLFEAVLQGLYQQFTASTATLAQFLARCRFPEDMEQFGRVMNQVVAEHREYLTMVYVDLTEFKGKHARSHYQDLTERFRSVLPPRFAESRAEAAVASWVDPAVAFTLLYMQFTSHFVVERLIGAVGHLGLDDEAAIKTIAKLFTYGMAPRSAEDGHARI